MNRAASRGINVEATLVGNAPRWAAGNHKVGPYKPDAAKFGRFTRDVAIHFNNRVRRYSVWNEPNLMGWLAPIKSSPRIYRNIYRSAWRRIRSVSRATRS